MSVSVIIPFRDRGRDPNRAANLKRVLEHWEGFAEVHVVDDGRTGDAQFNRSAAYNRGMRLTNADILVYAESDLIVPFDQILEGVALATSPGLVVPFSRFLAMEPRDSELVRQHVIQPADALAQQMRGDRQSIGAVNIVSRESLAMIGQFDEAFEGHAYDDDATERAFSICCGPTRFVDGPGWHQYHIPGALFATPESTEADRAATERNRQRYELYKQADTPERIRELTAGGE